MDGPASSMSLDVKPSTPHDVEGSKSLIRMLLSYSDTAEKSNTGAATFGGGRSFGGSGISFSNSVAIFAKKVLR